MAVAADTNTLLSLDWKKDWKDWNNKTLLLVHIDMMLMLRIDFSPFRIVSFLPISINTNLEILKVLKIVSKPEREKKFSSLQCVIYLKFRMFRREYLQSHSSHPLTSSWTFSRKKYKGGSCKCSRSNIFWGFIDCFQRMANFLSGKLDYLIRRIQYLISWDGYNISCSVSKVQI